MYPFFIKFSGGGGLLVVNRYIFGQKLKLHILSKFTYFCSIMRFSYIFVKIWNTDYGVCATCEGENPKVQISFESV